MTEGGAEAAAATAPLETRAAIFGVAGPTLGPDEADFLAEARPWGTILFARNIETPAQTSALVRDVRAALGWRAPVLIDQEGGRVARLRGPHWREWPPVGLWCAAADAGEISEPALWEALRLRYRLIADELTALGIDVDCAPLLDLRLPGASDVIGDRALGAEPGAVAARGAVVAAALLEGGVLPVVKHMPGHGRADVDSHAETPRTAVARATLSATDFAAFAALNDLPLGMTGHVVYGAVDPDRVATASPVVIGEVVRGEIGFDGLLMTDDLSMGAMSGDLRRRSAESLAAGCDLILHCNGVLTEMRDALSAVPTLAGDARRRADAAVGARRTPAPFDAAAAEERLDALGLPGGGGAHV